MYVHDLVSLFDPAGLVSIETIPVTHRRFIDVAIRPAARIQRYFVRATGVTDQRRTVTRRGPSRRDKCIPLRVLVPAISVQIKTAAAVIYKPSHDPRLAQWAQLSSCWIQGGVRQSRRAIASDALPEEALQRHFQFLVHKRHLRTKASAIASGDVCAAIRCCGRCDSIAEETAQGFDLEVSPAWFKGDLRQKIRG